MHSSDCSAAKETSFLLLFCAPSHSSSATFIFPHSYLFIKLCYYYLFYYKKKLTDLICIQRCYPNRRCKFITAEWVKHTLKQTLCVDDISKWFYWNTLNIKLYWIFLSVHTLTVCFHHIDYQATPLSQYKYQTRSDLKFVLGGSLD